MHFDAINGQHDNGSAGTVFCNYDFQIKNQKELQFRDNDGGSNWVALKGPSTVSSNITWTLPSSDGTNGQVLKTNGSGTLSWVDQSSGGGGGGGGAISSVTNFSNNRLITATGPSSLNGESALTFDTASGLLSLNHSTPEIKIRSSVNEGIPKLTMIGDYDADRGDIWQITTHNGVMSFNTDHAVAGTPNQTMLQLTGNLVSVDNSLVDVKGKLTVGKLATFSDNIRLSNDKYLYLSPSYTTYLTGNATQITIESNDTLIIN